MVKIGLNVLLVCISVIMGVAFSEAFLRLFYPKYEYAAESKYERNNLRIWSRPPNGRTTRRHPDTRLPHSIIYNNLALRQHRNFSEDELRSAINIGFFGDSFTENLRLAVPFSLTEVLDYLLNARGPHVNVLNFGVDAYGTDQCFLYYQGFQYNKHLDYVFYVMFRNDLRNIYENKLFTVDAKGALVRGALAESPWWIKLVSRLHITYLALDVRDRLPWRNRDRHAREYNPKRLLQGYQDYRRKPHTKRADTIQKDLIQGRQNDDLDFTITIFRTLLKRWRKSVESNGGKFYIVLLPLPTEDALIDVIGEGFNVINLYALFNETVKNYKYG